MKDKISAAVSDHKYNTKGVGKMRWISIGKTKVCVRNWKWRRVRNEFQ